MAMLSKARYDMNINHIMHTTPELFPNHMKGSPIIPEVKYINGSFFEHDWSNASMVFSNATCFDKYIMEEIFEKTLLLPKGAIFVNTSQKMPKKIMSNFNSVTPFQRLMSWGVARIFIYRRK